MRTGRRREAPRNRGTAGFTLFEALVSVAVMSAIVAALGAVAGQWLPNWHRGFGRVQRLETLDVGLQRLAADLEAAEFVTPNGASKGPIFQGDEKTVTFVRVGIAPGTTPHLEFVRLAETVDERGFALVRSHAPFKTLDPNRPIDAQLYFADPVVLIRAPFRVSFAFAGADRLWRGSWQDPALLPSAARIQVRDAATDKVLAFSTATLLHVDLPAECVTQKSVQQCIDGIRRQGSAPQPAQSAKPSLVNGSAP
ncbi:MAG: general secretion pathway protein GspJ [Hyphomicrobiales bacterium]|nr:general secretion pathway protein GspJ [Hyphomicrobiales bacterium]